MSDEPASPTPAADTVVSVAVPVAVDRAFDYLVPASFGPAAPGCRVVVPFGARVLVGVVRPRSADSDVSEGGQLRAVLELLDPAERPAVPAQLAELCEWIADYYLAPIGEVYRLALPAAAMASDTRRVRPTQQARELHGLDGPHTLHGGPLLDARLAVGHGDADSPVLDGHDRRLLAELIAAVGSSSRKAVSVAGLTRLEPPIPAVLRRVASLAEAGLITVETSPEAARRERTELHVRRTDRLRGAGSDEPALKRALGRSKQRRALLDHLEQQCDADGSPLWVGLSELRGPFPRVRQLLPPLLDAGLLVAREQLRRLDDFAVAGAAAGQASGPAASPSASQSFGEAPDEPPQLSSDQQRALDRLLAARERGGFHAALLYGITGSGKTEVYLRLIAELRVQGAGAIVLVPEIALTPQLAERFRARFADEVAVLHSGLTERQRLDAWAHIRSGQRPIVIGARSAVFAPVPKLGAIVVDEEHDGSFKQDDGVRYHARDVALVRGRSHGALVVLGSATPSLESWQGARDGRLELLELTSRPTPRPLPEVEIVDLRTHAPDAETLLSAVLRERLEATVAAGDQAILFLNRRGYTTALACRSCGSLQQCPDCSAPAMTYHLARNRLMCHLCGHIEAAPQRCLACGSTELEHGGAGTERVEVHLARDLPGIRVARLDRDSARGRVLHERLARFRRREIDVLIGTQMLSKGHDFPGVTLVGVLRAEHGLALQDFRASERVFQLLTQVAGRAGRGERPGRVVIQTWAPDHPAITFARGHDFAGFAAQELAARAEHSNPPVGHAALIRITGEQRPAVRERAAGVAGFVRELAARVAQGAGELTAHGPIDSPIERVNRRYRMQLLLRTRERPALRWVLGHLRRELGRRGSGRAATQVRVDVDPYSLL